MQQKDPHRIRTPTSNKIFSYNDDNATSWYQVHDEIFQVPRPSEQARPIFTSARVEMYEYERAFEKFTLQGRLRKDSLSRCELFIFFGGYSTLRFNSVRGRESISRAIYSAAVFFSSFGRISVRCFVGYKGLHLYWMIYRAEYVICTWILIESRLITSIARLSHSRALSLCWKTVSKIQIRCGCEDKCELWRVMMWGFPTD